MTEPTINDHNPVADRLAVSPAEAARLAGVGRTTIYEAIGSGALRSLKIGKRRLILIVSLRDWLETAQQAVDSAAQRRAHACQMPMRATREFMRERAALGRDGRSVLRLTEVRVATEGEAVQSAPRQDPPELRRGGGRESVGKPQKHGSKLARGRSRAD